jgi:hypothetical protein
MQQENEKRLIEAFYKSSPVHQMCILALAERCAAAPKRRQRSSLGADEQAISINVLPSSVASR